jgi:hypothetical protein
MLPEVFDTPDILVDPFGIGNGSPQTTSAPSASLREILIRPTRHTVFERKSDPWPFYSAHSGLQNLCGDFPRARGQSRSPMGYRKNDPSGLGISRLT